MPQLTFVDAAAVVYSKYGDDSIFGVNVKHDALITDPNPIRGFTFELDGSVRKRVLGQRFQTLEDSILDFVCQVREH